MTTETTEKVDYSKQFKDLQKRIVLAREKGEDPAPILKEQAELRAKIAAAAEIEAADQIVKQRQDLRDKAEAIKAQVQVQNDAISAFLKARDALVTELAPLVEKSSELMALQELCYSQFGIGQIGLIPKLPESYLSSSLRISILTSRDGTSDERQRTSQGVFYLRSGLGCLQSIIALDNPIQHRAATEFEEINEPQLLMPVEKQSWMVTSEPETDTETNYINCCVCQHPQAGAINEALRTGVLSLRDIEAKYPGVSRSSLSRHEMKHLKHISQEIILQEPTTNER